MSFDPFTLAGLAKVVGAAGSVVSALGNMQAANYQAAVAERNRILFEENARAEIEQSQREQADWSESARGQLGALAAEAAAGGGTRAGSPLLQQKGAEGLARRDATRIREEGVVRADVQFQAAADAGAQAQMARSQSQFALFGGGLGALDSYIGGATRIRRMKGLIA